MKLVTLECHWNMLSKLDVEHNPHLKELSCSYNALFTLELLQNKRLERLECASNYISHLDITSCVNLEEIRCNHNHLTALDISHNSELKSVRCFNNHITKLDISHNEQLEELYCSENKLTELDSKQNPKLERLQYADNLITEPDCMVPEVGIFQYNASLINYNVTVPYKGRELVVTASVPTKAAMEVLIPVIEEAWKHFDELTERTLQLIGEAHPNEDVNELVLADVEFQEGGHFRVGYDAGDTPAGRLCLYAEFDGKLEMSERLIYETY
ncbi:leucine-rich repeat domain-containing protein [Paenibacillus sp. QZ-Y1]|uniref:leucine-rich repeat domain-containing protein n=1 Tax=Paenibacillus sp. QZ-Y1 TaxID=3414511 RepID=UPI003F78BC62